VAPRTRSALAESAEGLLELKHTPTTLSPSRSKATSCAALANSRSAGTPRMRGWSHPRTPV